MVTRCGGHKKNNTHTQKKTAGRFSESGSCMFSSVFMGCANEIQQVIPVFIPKTKSALLSVEKTVPEGEGEGGHLPAPVL